MTQTQIANEITYRRTVEAVIGIHESGARITQFRDIVVRPSDNAGFDPSKHDLTDAGEREWWQGWCNAEGGFAALRAERTQPELDAIAVKAGYADWDDVVRELDNAGDADAIIGIQESVIAAAE
jgi:hypothetical protein